ncbi:unnamed protein product [Cyclocybe aegerita]|uniref:Uncharacterized protein n=1 Tax=Cyclocybe aegerita TaxID=1973307 RepID=A0A8S0W4N1_CYCAE|nr:unnamed protein product [Cyclocybe aegerita]
MHIGPNAANMNMQNMQLQAGANLNLKPPTAQQLQQWNIASPMQRPSSVANSIVNGIDGQLNVLGRSVPVRSPSANGTRPGMRNGVHVSMSPHLHNSPLLLPNITQSQSPPRMPTMPNMGMASPSLHIGSLLEAIFW